MGSPLAVIGTVFRHRRTLAKTGAAVGGVLMLPILFLVMLPGLVFGDLSENTGALTSNTVISENIRASNQAIVEVLQESHDALLAKINAEIARLPEGDTASISDPYASSIIVNANQLIAQFCASQDDYKNINISKLKSLIRENEDGLFSYDVTSETATVEVPAEEENAPPRKVTFTRHTYTVSYAGDAYFADHHPTTHLYVHQILLPLNHDHPNIQHRMSLFFHNSAYWYLLLHSPILYCPSVLQQLFAVR